MALLMHKSLESPVQQALPLFVPRASQDVGGQPVLRLCKNDRVRSVPLLQLRSPGACQPHRRAPA